MDTSADPPQQAVDGVPPGENVFIPIVDVNERLAMPPTQRIRTGVLAAMGCGFLLGASYGGQSAGYVFRAENAHRLPKSQRGWFFYHKTKNYKMAYAGMREGARMGVKLGVWTGALMVAEQAIDSLRPDEGKDALSTVVAAMGTAGAWSLWRM